MPSLADLGTVFGQSAPAGFTLADTAIQSGLGQAQADFQTGLVKRNLSQFDLPDLMNSQAARGALRTSATDNKAFRLATGAQDQLSSIQLSNNPAQARLASNALLAQTGIQL